MSKQVKEASSKVIINEENSILSSTVEVKNDVIMEVIKTDPKIKQLEDKIRAQTIVIQEAEKLIDFLKAYQKAKGGNILIIREEINKYTASYKAAKLTLYNVK
jgi:hypothetical protein